ncbi:hypothetical protein EDF55_0202 [Curtobacterium sp. ZW137]|nr:hypothetical protein EDF55_0202 [Curtobacterium sp. ZW137]
MRELFARIESEAGISPHSVEITITETPKVNWGIRGMNAEDLVLDYEIDVESPMDQTGLVDLIRARQRDLGHPLVVGISGYCGSGKSTLARTLAAELAGAVRIRGDDFLDPVRSHRRSTDWDGVDRRRLLDSVLAPHRAAQPGVFHRFDWTTRSLGPAEPLPSADILVVDLIGLFHPDTLPSLDVTVWCDVELDVAAQRAWRAMRGSAGVTSRSGETCGSRTSATSKNASPRSGARWRATALPRSPGPNET